MQVQTLGIPFDHIDEIVCVCECAREDKFSCRDLMKTVPCGEFCMRLQYHT